MTKDMARHSTCRWRTVAGAAIALAYAALFPGCGGGGTSGPNPVSTPTPRPSVRNVIVEETFTGLPPLDPSDVAFYLHFVTGVVGDLDITVDWTFASNDVDFLLVRGTLEQALSPACQADDSPDCPLQLVSTAVTLSKPEVLTVASAAAGDYVVAVANQGTTDESGVVVVGLTTGAATTPPSVGGTRSITASSLGSRLTGLR